MPAGHRLREGNHKRLWEEDLVEVLVRVGLQLLAPRLLRLLLRREALRRGDAELGKVALRLLRTLVRVSVLDAQAEHGGARALRVENVVDVAFEFEKVVLPQTYFLVLQLNRLLDDRAKVLLDLDLALLVKVLVDVRAPVHVLHLDVLLVLPHPQKQRSAESSRADGRECRCARHLHLLS